MQGKFISFEGLDCSGKSTNIAMLSEHLKSRGYDVIVTREPGGCELSEKIRTLIFENKMQVETELLLFFASRTEHLAKTIVPALAAGKIVLSDRFVDSSFAFQGSQSTMLWQMARLLEDYFVISQMPNHTLFFDVPVDECLRRLANRHEGNNRFDHAVVEEKTRRRAAYLDRLRTDPNRIVRIDALPDIEIVTDSVRRWANTIFPVVE